MKRCPECRKDYVDDTLLYCLDDGAALVQGTVTDEPATAILSGDRSSDEGLTAALKTQVRTETVTLRLSAFLSRVRLPWIVALLLLIGLVVAVVYAIRNAGVSRQTDLVKTAFYIQPPHRPAGYGQIEISPDGKNIVLNSNSKLWLRGIDSLEGRFLAGTDGVQGFPFWSPDGRSIVFFGVGKTSRIDLADGTVREIADAPLASGGAGGTWSRDGTILVNGGGIARVPPNGGAPQVLAGYESKQGQLLRWPRFLPDGKHFLFLATNEDRTKSEVYVGSTDGDERRLLFASDSDATFSPSPDGKGGYLLFARAEALLAHRFDPDTLQLVGEPFRVAETIRVTLNQRVMLSVSDNGTLVYDPTTEQDEGRQLTWYDRTGKAVQTVGRPGTISRFRLSPDERSFTTLRRASGAIMNDLLVSDIASGASSKLISIPGTNETLWSPDGKYVVWNQATGDGKTRLVKKLASGVGEAEVLVESPDRVIPTDWSPDGKFILYTAFDRTTGSDIWTLPLEGDRKPFPYVQTQYGEAAAVFSPDGKYVAYQSREFRREEVYIQSFATSGAKVPVSTNGGNNPYWPRKGRELFYIQADGKLMAVEIKPGEPPGIGTPHALFDIATVRTPRISDYNVSNDGQRFLFISRGPDAASPPIIAILNWSAGLSR